MDHPERRDDERTGQEPGSTLPGNGEDATREPSAFRGTSEPWGQDAPEGVTGETVEDEGAAPEASENPDAADEVTTEVRVGGGLEETIGEDGTLEGGQETGVAGGSEPPGEEAEGRDGASVELEELGARLEIKDNHIRELYERIAATRLAADEAAAAREAGLGHVRALEDERERLKERIRTLEEKVRERRRRREGIDRNVGRLERENERLRAEVARRDFLLRRREQEMEAIDVEAEDLVTRKDVALIDALRRVEGLERDLDERETEVAELRANVDDLLADLRAEYDLRAHLAEPANRLRAGIELFNDSGQIQNVLGLSRSLGQPEVHVDLEDGDEPAVILSFTWQGVSWQTYSANPGLAVEEPRVYMMSAGEDLSGVERQRPNARVGPGGRVLLGL